MTKYETEFPIYHCMFIFAILQTSFILKSNLCRCTQRDAIDSFMRKMEDLVFVKFNSKLRQKKDNKDKDPIKKSILDALEDEDNEWITDIEPPEGDGEQEQEGEIGESSQGVAAAS